MPLEKFIERYLLSEQEVIKLMKVFAKWETLTNLMMRNVKT